MQDRFLLGDNLFRSLGDNLAQLTRLALAHVDVARGRRLVVKGEEAALCIKVCHRSQRVVEEDGLAVGARRIVDKEEDVVAHQLQLALCARLAPAHNLGGPAPPDGLGGKELLDRARGGHEGLLKNVCRLRARLGDDLEVV